MITVYGDIYSGNCYKVKLLLCLLGRAHRWQHVDILAGDSRTATFLARNPNGRVPVVEFEDGRCLWESNAILNYFATDTAYMPRDRFQRAQVLQWQFFEQYSHEPYIATSRYIVRYLGAPDSRAADLAARREGGWAALRVMESHLREQAFLVGEQYSIADLSLYAYTHVAHEGGFALDAYPAIQAWLGRVAAQPGHVTMEQFD